MALHSATLLLLLGLVLSVVSGFMVHTPRCATSNNRLMTTKLFVGPLQKITNREEYEKAVQGLMKTKGFTREQAEKEYGEFLDNPNNYALNKGEAYYKSLGYKNLMDGVVGEADKEGKGEEVRQRIDDFKKQSQIKATAVLAVAFAAFIYSKIQYDIAHPFIPSS
eukprot:CAMPEP_0202446494 /NCGR_PEP_ID=MMETSP1360-20130828/4968_1 /ASSEMBLY_ACC=CAM_ASM_000848 /TAXON_ID=515479 /ORGANISM="Licmophora paradoxa, Strain CCMP2313" /LENGTH=164 /DNA_ID=CAMNT_0049062981 /DNA_START=13 /DNA_END=507 /DNA_ORIENTATION=-